MGLADRDYMRDRPTESSAPRSLRYDQPWPAAPSRRLPRWRRRERITGTLALAVAVSALATALASGGYLPSVKIPGRSADTDSRTVRLGSATGLDVVGPVGKQWCLRLTSGRICAKTGSDETGRHALTRALEARGYRVTR